MAKLAVVFDPARLRGTPLEPEYYGLMAERFGGLTVEVEGVVEEGEDPVVQVCFRWRMRSSELLSPGAARYGEQLAERLRSFGVVVDRKLKRRILKEVRSW